MAIIIKPIVTEKMTQISEKFNRYGFRVSPEANKPQIKKAVLHLDPEPLYQIGSDTG